MKANSGLENKKKRQGTTGIYYNANKTYTNTGVLEGSDDFSRKGIGDKLNVDNQRKRGRKETGESQYRKYKNRKKKKGKK